MLLNQIFLCLDSSYLTAGIGPIIVFTPSSIHSNFIPSWAALQRHRIQTKHSNNRRDLNIYRLLNLKGGIRNLFSAVVLSWVRNVDFQPRPIGDEGSSSSPSTRVYINPRSSNRCTNSGYFAFIRSYTMWLSTIGVSPPVPGSTSQKKNNLEGNSGTCRKAQSLQQNLTKSGIPNILKLRKKKIKIR